MFEESTETSGTWGDSEFLMTLEIKNQIDKPEEEITYWGDYAYVETTTN